MTVNSQQVMFGGVLLSKGGGSSSASLRDLLVPGEYIPGIEPDSVGLIDTFVAQSDLEATGSLGRVPMDPNTVLYENVTFWGSLYLSSLDPTKTYVFNNCRLAGPDPAIMKTRGAGSTIQSGCVINFGANPPRAIFNDCEINGHLWNTERGRTITMPWTGSELRPAYPAVYGIYGCNVTLNRCKVWNVLDGWNFVGPAADDVGQVANQYNLIHASHISTGDWANGTGLSDPNGYHGDGFQTNKGRNVEIRYSLIGGLRNNDGYTMPLGQGYNAGSDFWTSCLMLQQEVSSSYINLVTNVNIHHNWLAGGATSVNLVYNQGNTLGGVTLAHNKILRRATTVGSHGVRNDGKEGQTSPGTKNYIIRQPEITAIVENNTYWDWFGDINGTGVLVPITVG